MPYSAIRHHSTKAPPGIKLAALAAAARKHPLGLALRDPPKRGSRGQLFNSNSRVRVHVVSESLCDDALALLAPSLEPYKGCNIIDFCPGAGLWSRKIHEYLSPRSHLLVEPQRDRFHEFLAPLIEKEGSTYKYLGDTVEGWTATAINYVKLTQRTDIPKVEAIAKDDLVTNKPTLILANFTRTVKTTSTTKAITLSSSPSEPAIYEFMNRVKLKSFPHADEPARMLTWVLDRDKFNSLPKHVFARRGPGMMLEDLFSVHEIAGSSEPLSIRRASRLDLMSSLKVAQRMEQAGIQLPHHRQSHIHEMALAYLRERQGNDVQDQTSSAHSKQNPFACLDELAELERGLYDGTLKRYKVKEKGADQRLKKITAEYRRWEELRDKFDELVGASTSPGLRSYDVERAVLAISDMIQYEREVMSKHIQDHSGNPLQLDEFEEERMKALEEVVEKEMLTCDIPDKTAKVINTVDNYEAFTMQPPLLTWDQRPFEPLEVEEDEFFPLVKLALLDYQPLQPLDRVEGFVHMTIFARALRGHVNRGIIDALESLQAGCSADLIANCPSIRNPLVGGKLHLEHLRVRMLTQQMYKELTAAWYEWPFRLPDELLAQRLGSSTTYIDFDNGDFR